MRFIGIVLSLACVSVSACQKADEAGIGTLSVTNKNDCVATSEDLYALREVFKNAAQIIGLREKIDRQPLEKPFLEPPTVRISIQQNPSIKEYAWIVRLQQGCVFDDVQPGFKLDEVEYSAKIDSSGKLVDDNMHKKIVNN